MPGGEGQPPLHPLLDESAPVRFVIHLVSNEYSKQLLLGFRLLITVIIREHVHTIARPRCHERHSCAPLPPPLVSQVLRRNGFAIEADVRRRWLLSSSFSCLWQAQDAPRQAARLHWAARSCRRALLVWAELVSAKRSAIAKHLGHWNPRRGKPRLRQALHSWAEAVGQVTSCPSIIVHRDRRRIAVRGSSSRAPAPPALASVASKLTLPL